MQLNNPHTTLYASVILPVKYNGEISYIVPKIYRVEPGCRVKVDFAGKIYSAVVSKILSGNNVPTISPDGKEIQYKPILAVEDLPKILPAEMALWEKVAQYYLCSTGEVYKAAYPALSVKQEGVKPRKGVKEFIEKLALEEESSAAGKSAKETKAPKLSGPQNNALSGILQSFAGHAGKPVLLRGVTGSGKTEIYITLALQQINQGKNVLYMVPEIAISKQLQSRLKKIFGERLLTFHSKQTAAEKARIHKILQYNALNATEGNTAGLACEKTNTATIVLGTRSSLFLPFSNLGLVIVDEEHDSSYKQTEPAPRYHAKDTAIMLAQLHGANILLGSATPSFESEYNCISGKFALVELNEKYFGAIPPQVEIIDTNHAHKTGQMVGSFSRKLINEIRKTIDGGYQVLVFRNRRSYSPIVECSHCGAIPKCPHCNVYLSYHKYNNTLRCHYCEYMAHFSGICKKCSNTSFNYKGAGTEKLEEELAQIFPDVPISRYDADIAKSKKAEEQTIKEFAEGKTSILVGTQMISKGFDFEKLKLVAIVQADTILGIQDFRGDEKSLQLFSQLMGRTGRRGIQGKLIIQTGQKEHPVLLQLRNPHSGNSSTLPPITAQLLAERKEYHFAPFVRMVKITVRHKNATKLEELCNQISEKLQGNPNLHYTHLTGPFSPVIDKVRGEFIKCFYIKFARNGQLAQNKSVLLETIRHIKGNQAIILDVDPL